MLRQKFFDSLTLPVILCALTACGAGSASDDPTVPELVLEEHLGNGVRLEVLQVGEHEYTPALLRSVPDGSKSIPMDPEVAKALSDLIAFDSTGKDYVERVKAWAQTVDVTGIADGRSEPAQVVTEKDQTFFVQEVCATAQGWNNNLCDYRFNVTSHPGTTCGGIELVAGYNAGFGSQYAAVLNFFRPDPRQTIQVAVPDGEVRYQVCPGGPGNWDVRMYIHTPDPPRDLGVAHYYVEP